jgi:hypothetical protein
MLLSHPAAEFATFDKTIETISGGFVTPTIVGDGTISGCVYRADGTKVARSERFGGWRGDLFRSVNPEQLERPPCIERKGRGIYLGYLMAGHYGHFITEGLCTFWIFETLPAEEFDYFLFSPFVFGTRIPDYAVQCMRALGIDTDKIVILGEEPMAFEELVVPERLFRLNHSADPALAWVHRRIRSCIVEEGKRPELVYLSRRKLSLKQLTRVIANEVLVEKLFRHAGFTVVYPEELPFKEQLSLYANARVVAGPSGSALHNSLFMRPGAILIELGDPRYGCERAPSQILCDSVSGVETSLIPFVGTIRDEGKSISVDVEDLRKNLIRILKAAGMAAPDLENSQVGMNLPEIVETIYLTFRPILGTKLRKLLRVFGR